jgi:hypothetical protein
MKALSLLGLFLVLSFSASSTTLFYFSDSPHGFYTFDTTTGISSLRAPVSVTQRFFGMDTRPTDGTVFAVNYDDANPSGLYTINVSTGTFSLVGMTGIAGMVGLAFDPLNAQLFGLRSGGSLFSINQVTGAATLLGNTGFTDRDRGLVFSPSGQLYVFSESGQLYHVDPATGGTTAVGGSGNPVVTLSEDAAFDSTGTLYASDYTGLIFRTDPITGNGVKIGSTGNDVLGLVALPVPEPASVILGTTALTILFFLRRNGGPALAVQRLSRTP